MRDSIIHAVVGVVGLMIGLAACHPYLEPARAFLFPIATALAWWAMPQPVQLARSMRRKEGVE